MGRLRILAVEREPRDAPRQARRHEQQEHHAHDTHLLCMPQPFPRERERCGSVERPTAAPEEAVPCGIHREAMAREARVLAGLSVRSRRSAIT